MRIIIDTKPCGIETPSKKCRARHRLAPVAAAVACIVLLKPTGVEAGLQKASTETASTKSANAKPGSGSPKPKNTVTKPPLTATTAAAPSSTAATVGASPNQPAGKQQTLRVALSFAPRAGLSVISDDAFLLTRLGAAETLVRANSSGESLPLLATSWDQLNPTTWRFILRSGVSFHDGTPLTAAAVANSINTSASATAAPRALRGAGIKAQAVDEKTLEVTTARPDLLLPLRLSSPGSAILAPSAYASGIPSPINTGTGPYRLVQYIPEQKLNLAANPKYWGKAPSITQVEAKIIVDPTARAAALRAGELDLAEGIPPTQIEAVKKTAGLTVALYDLPRTTSIYLNSASGPFEKATARQAVDASIDRRVLATSLLEGAAEPAAGYFGPAVKWDPDVVVPQFDLVKAKQLVEKSGLKRVRLWTYPARSELPELAVAIKSMLSNSGVEVDITVAEYGTLEPKVLGGEFDMFLLSRSYMVDVPDPGAFLLSDFACAGSYNLNRFCETRFDTLVNGLAGASTRSSRERIFALAAQSLDVDSVGVPILHDKARIGLTKKLRGFVPDPLEQRLITPELKLEP